MLDIRLTRKDYLWMHLSYTDYRAILLHIIIIYIYWPNQWKHTTQYRNTILCYLLIKSLRIKRNTQMLFRFFGSLLWWFRLNKINSPRQSKSLLFIHNWQGRTNRQINIPSSGLDILYLKQSAVFYLRLKILWRVRQTWYKNSIRDMKENPMRRPISPPILLTNSSSVILISLSLSLSWRRRGPWGISRPPPDCP